MTTNKARIKEYYNHLSDSYDQLYGEEQARKHEEALTIVGNRKFSLLIDVGCGTGALLCRGSSNYSMAVGTDLSQKMVRMAKQRVGSEKTEFVVSDGSWLPLRSHAADIVLSVSVLQSNSDIDQLRELSRIAKPEGLLLVTTIRPESASHGSSLPSADPGIQLTEMERLYVVRVIGSQGQD